MKPIDDSARYCMLEALQNQEFVVSIDSLNGSLLDFGVSGKLNSKIMKSHGFSMLMLDIVNGMRSELICKPSVTGKTVYLDDVQSADAGPRDTQHGRGAQTLCEFEHRDGRRPILRRHL